MKNLLFVLMPVFFVIKTYSQTSISTTAIPFLLINTDARAGGMGDVGVATSSDASSIFHNPAKISFNKSKTIVGVNYTPWLRNLTNDIFVGGGSYINKYNETSAWALDLKYFSLGEVILTNASGKSTGTENPNELALTGAYSLKLSKNFSMAIGLKYIHSNYKISSTNSNLNPVNTFAVDVSGYYQSEVRDYGRFNGRYRLGFNIANIGPKIEYEIGSPNFIPTIGKIGGGFDLIFDNQNILGLNLEFTRLLVPFNSDSTEGSFEGIFTSFTDRNIGEITWALGAEYLYKDAFALRTGYFHENIGEGDCQYFTLGAGFNAKSFILDFSYLINSSNVNNPLENTLRFSLSFNL